MRVLKGQRALGLRMLQGEHGLSAPKPHGSSKAGRGERNAGSSLAVAGAGQNIASEPMEDHLSAVAAAAPDAVAGPLLDMPNRKD